MQKLLTTRLIGAVAVLILIGAPAAMAQKANNKGSPPGAANQLQNIPEAPVSRAPIKYLPRNLWATRTIP
jgi:hypothetical protein